MSTESKSGTQVDFNHWLLRFLALVIDSIITYIPAYLIYAVIAAIIWPVPWPWSTYGYYWGGWAPWWAMWLLWPLLAGVIQLLYFVLLETYWGATIGKKILGFQVQMVNGSKVSFDKAFIRNISKIHGLFLFLDWLFAVVSPGPDPRQKYTDRIAGTTVVSIKQVFSAQPPPPPPPP